MWIVINYTWILFSYQYRFISPVSNHDLAEGSSSHVTRRRCMWRDSSERLVNQWMWRGPVDLGVLGLCQYTIHVHLHHTIHSTMICIYTYIYIDTYSMYNLYIYIYYIILCIYIYYHHPFKATFQGGPSKMKDTFLGTPPLKCKIGRWTSPGVVFVGRVGKIPSTCKFLLF